MGSSFLKRWYNRVKRDLTVGKHDPRGDLKVLPCEIILEIVDYLSIAAALTLALTCRPYYHALKNRLPELRSQHSKGDFLQLLERDIPSLYFCHSCLELHPWSKHWGLRRTWNECDNGRSVEFAHNAPFDFSQYLRFQHARIVMNHHFYGASHGYSLGKSRLHGQELRQVRGHDVQLHFKRTLRILDDELYLLNTCTIWHPSGETIHVRDLFKSLQLLRLCNHVWVQNKFELFIHQIGPYIIRMLNKPPPKRSRIATTSCPDCLTDLSLSLLPLGKGQGGGWKFEIAVYQRMGSCRSPYDWKWRSMAESSRLNEPRYLKYPAGVVRQRWAKEDGGEVDTDQERFCGPSINLPFYRPGHRQCPWNSNCDDHDCATYGLDGE